MNETPCLVIHLQAGLVITLELLANQTTRDAFDIFIPQQNETTPSNATRVYIRRGTTVSSTIKTSVGLRRRSD